MSTPTAARSRATSATGLDVATSAAAAELLVAELDDLADRIEREAARSGASRITAARVRGLRSHAYQFAGLHEGIERSTAGADVAEHAADGAQ